MDTPLHLHTQTHTSTHTSIHASLAIPPSFPQNNRAELGKALLFPLPSDLGYCVYTSHSCLLRSDICRYSYRIAHPQTDKTIAGREEGVAYGAGGGGPLQAYRLDYIIQASVLIISTPQDKIKRKWESIEPWQVLNLNVCRPLPPSAFLMG